MKKLEIIIRPEKLEDLKDILTVSGVTGMMISNIMGFGNQMGYTHQYRGVTYSVNLVSKLRVETVVKDEIVQEIVDKIAKFAKAKKITKPVLVVPMDIRHMVFVILAEFVRNITVLAHEELVSDYNIKFIGKV